MKWALTKKEPRWLFPKPEAVCTPNWTFTPPLPIPGCLYLLTYDRHGPIVQGALEWLEQNQDKTLEEIKAAESSQAASEEGPALQPGEQPRSLVCNDCGKKFRSQAQAEFHASKTQHVDFSESTEEIAPLTEEEKKAKLAELREKLAAKRALQSEQDKIDQKRNEVSLFSKKKSVSFF